MVQSFVIAGKLSFVITGKLSFAINEDENENA